MHENLYGGDRLSEKELQTAILKKYGALPGLRLWRQNTGAAVGMSVIAQARREGYLPANLPVTRYGSPGMPDIMGIIGPTGRFVGIECKSESGQQTQEQITWQKIITQLGGVYILARYICDVDFYLSSYLIEDKKNTCIPARNQL
jgi:hypothetical protein